MGHLAQAGTVETLYLRIGNPVAMDIRQPIGLGGVGPHVACLTQVVVLIAACRHNALKASS